MAKKKISKTSKKGLLPVKNKRKYVRITQPKSEELFRTLTETTTTAIFIYKGEQFVYVNKASEILTGYTKDELLSMHFWDVVHPEYKELIKQCGLARLRGEKIPDHYEFKIVRKDGSERWIDFTAGVIQWHYQPAAIGTAFDITERKRAEEALQKSEKRYHRFIESASITSTWFPWSWPELNLLTGFSMSLENIFPRTRNLIISLLLPLFVVSMFFIISCKSTEEQQIKVGILHSLTGTMAISEKAVVNGTLLAIEEINQLGGINGQKILPLVVDGKSDLQTFKQEAERLITEEKVSVVFGCWTSASRKTVLPVFEKHNHLLFYPVQYEGLEQSPNIIYNGAAPNQQIIPAVKWCFDNLGKRFFLVGSDYVFPHTANEIIKEQANLLGAKIVGEEYILLGSSDVNDIIQKIIKTKPDVIINTINGSSNIPFFREMRKAGITPDKFPVMSFSISEEELGAAEQNGDKIPLDIVAGNYAAWNYFQSIESDENKKFVEKFKKRYGAEQVISDPVEAGYFGVYLWAQAVKDAGTSDVNEVLKTIKNQSMQAPEGMVYIDADNNHTWKTVRIGKIKKDGQFQIVWSSNNPVRPIPYPPTRNKLEWDKFLSELFKSWDGKWEKTK